MALVLDQHACARPAPPPPVPAERSATFGGAELVVLDELDGSRWRGSRTRWTRRCCSIRSPRPRRLVHSESPSPALKCNALEAAALLGSDVPAEPPAIENASQRLMDLGVGAVDPTAGPERQQVHYRDADEHGWLLRSER